MDRKACRKGPCVSLITDPSTVLLQDNCWPMGSQTVQLRVSEQRRNREKIYYFFLFYYCLRAGCLILITDQMFNRQDYNCVKLQGDLIRALLPCICCLGNGAGRDHVQEVLSLTVHGRRRPVHRQTGVDISHGDTCRGRMKSG